MNVGKLSALGASAFLLATWSAACSSGESPATDAGTPDSGVTPTEVVTQQVGPEGGTVEGTHFSLQIPAGALTDSVEITITEGVEATLPALLARRSAVYELEPDGLAFAEPIAFSVTLAAPSSAVQMYWGDGAGSFEPVPTSIAGAVVTGTAQHFTPAMVSELCGAAWCDGDVLKERTDVSVVPDGALFRCEYQLVSADCTALANTGPDGVCQEAEGPAACMFTCASTYGDCDLVVANGCEVNLSIDQAHCGVCNRACSGGAPCIGGQCQGSSPCDPNPCADLADTCADADTRHHYTGVCTEPTAGGFLCEAQDLDCPTGQVCTEGVCAGAGTCPEDGHADTRDTAQALARDAAVEGTVCGAFDPDADYFAVAVTEGEGCALLAQVELLGEGEWPLQPNDAAYAVRLKLLDPDGGELSQTFARWSGMGLYITVPSPGTYVLALVVDEGATTERYRYRLRYSLECPAPAICPPDDQYEPNSSVTSAWDFGAEPPAVIDGVMCPTASDQDYFKFQVPTTSMLLATEWTVGAGMTLEERGVSPSPNIALYSGGSNTTYTRAWAVQAGHTYHFSLSANNATFSYRVELRPILPISSCGAPDAYEPNQSVAQAKTLPLKLGYTTPFVVDAAACGADVDVFGPFPQGDFMHVRLAYDPGQGTPRLSVVNSDGVEQGVGANPTNTPHVLFLEHGDPQGQYIKVEANGADVPYFLFIDIGWFS